MLVKLSQWAADGGSCAGYHLPESLTHAETALNKRRQSTHYGSCPVGARAHAGSLRGSQSQSRGGKVNPPASPKQIRRALQMASSVEGVCKSSAVTAAPRTESADEFLGPSLF